MKNYCEIKKDNILVSRKGNCSIYSRKFYVLVKGSIIRKSDNKVVDSL